MRCVAGARMGTVRAEPLRSKEALLAGYRMGRVIGEIRRAPQKRRA